MSEEIEKLVLLGATGSIGESTLEVLRQHRDRMQIVAVACNTNFEKLLAIAREFNVPNVAIYDENSFGKAKNSLTYHQELIFTLGWKAYSNW